MEYLLNLGKLQTLQEKFKINNVEKEEAALAERKLKLAQTQAHIPQLEAQLKQVQQALTAVALHETLEELTNQNNQLNDLVHQHTALTTELDQLEQTLQQIATVKQQRETLRELILLRQDCDRFQTEANNLREALQENERKEHEDLPRLEKQLGDLERLRGALEILFQLNHTFAQLEKQCKSGQAEIEQIASKISEAETLTVEIEKSSVEI